VANNKSAEKRNRQRDKRRLQNRQVVGRMRSALRRARKAIETESSEAPVLVRDAAKNIDRAVTKGAVHRRTGSRLISRLSRRAQA
jgi:small subunit ribosomal protein S20